MVEKTVWLSRLPEFARELNTTVVAIVDGIEEIAYNELVFGGTLTNSPGQPADLRDGDWERIRESDTSRTIGTSEPSARSVEDGVSYKHGGVPLTKLKSDVGGFHSLNLVHQNADKIIPVVIQQVKR